MELEHCKEVLGMRWEPLTMSGEQLVERYEQASALVRNGCAEALLRDWVTFLLRLRHYDLETIEARTNDPNPWRPFHLLTARIDLKRDQQAKEPGLTKYLTAAREHVDVIVYSWIVSRYGENVMRKLVAYLDKQ